VQHATVPLLFATNQRRLASCKYCRRQVPTRAEQEEQLREPPQTPVERARAARGAGARLFQLTMPVSDTVGFVKELSGTVTSTRTAGHAEVLEAIEAEGWRLEHVGYVYRVLGIVSRDKFLASGQQEAVTGEIVGIYLFRIAAGDA
jgi:hypothetical protein